MFYANANNKGYYRNEYDAEDYGKILSVAETQLTPPERIGFAGNEWALMRSGRGTIGDYMNLVSALRNDPNADVIEDLASALDTVDGRIATPSDRKLLAAWVRQQFGPAYNNVKDVTSSDSVEKRQLRAILFAVLGDIGHDPQVIAQAKDLTEKYVADPASVEPSLVRPAIRIATENGDGHLFDQLQQISKTSNNPDVQTTALFSLANFHDPELVNRALDYAASGQVRNQDSVFLFASEMRSRDTRPIAWDYIQKNWDKVHAQLTTMMGGYLVGSTGSFCSAEKEQDVQAFFAAHPVMAAQRAVKRSTDAIHDCMELRAAQQPKLTQWLSQQNLNAGSM
jgi:aminopeptidase N/puromycin-sensitive aminopeptidase